MKITSPRLSTVDDLVDALPRLEALTRPARDEVCEEGIVLKPWPGLHGLPQGASNHLGLRDPLSACVDPELTIEFRLEGYLETLHPGHVTSHFRE